MTYPRYAGFRRVRGSANWRVLVTLGQWIVDWLNSGAPGRRQEAVSQRTLERYEQLLNTHVKPVLGDRPQQQLKSTEIDKLYEDIAAAGEIAPRTMHHVHVVFKSSMGTAFRTGLIATNPMLRLKKKLSAKVLIPEDDAEIEADDIGEGLDEAQLAALVGGFKSSSLCPIVALAAATGARRNELLALRWIDFDTDKKALRIEWALEQTKLHGIRRKRPKSARGIRTISLDDATVRMLVAERERHLRTSAGIPDGVDVDLSLIRLPKNTLMFPALPEKGKDFDFTKSRDPRNFSKEFARRARVIGFGSTRFHDLRGTHATALLDAGIPVHTVAQRIGDDPATLLRWYAKRKRTKAADVNLANAIGTFAAGFLSNS
ncbi:Phage integrase family protein [Bradyrhizobium erythrophlei]|nr:Phage integrase family protein [Bradyrhizobium erythrophlei]